MTQLHFDSIEETVPSANQRQVGGSHYCINIQPWDYIAANGLDYFQGNVIKYVTRWREKGGVADLEKARHYLDKYIELSKESQCQTGS